MTRYFRITSASERALWEDFRTQWVKHRDAVLAFMNDELKAEAVRCNHFGAPIMAMFVKKLSEERNVAESYFQLTTDRRGYRTMTRKGIKHFDAKLNAIADLFPLKLPGQCAEYRQNFSVVPVWQSEETPIYLVVKSDQVRLGLPFPYREMSEEEYAFRTAADDFRVADAAKFQEVIANL